MIKCFMLHWNLSTKLRLCSKTIYLFIYVWYWQMYLQHCDKYVCTDCITVICYNFGEKGGVDFYINKVKVILWSLQWNCNSCDRDHEPYDDIYFCNGCDWTYCCDCYQKWLSEICYQCIVKKIQSCKNEPFKLKHYF